MARLVLFTVGADNVCQRVTFEHNELQEIAEKIREILRKWWRTKNFNVRVNITPGDHTLIVEPTNVAVDVQLNLLRAWDITL